MNRWLVGVGLLGISLLIIGYFSPWAVMYAEVGDGMSVKYGGFFAGEVLALGLFAMFCIFGAAIIPTGKPFTSIATKIIGVFVAVCGVAILISLVDTFRVIQALIGPFSQFVKVRPDYGFFISIAGGIFTLMAGFFGMVD